MSPRSRLRSILLAGLALVAASPGPSRAPDEAADFARFVDDYFTARFAAHPTEGTSAGLHEYDDKLEDLSRREITARVGMLRDQLARLATIQSPRPDD